MDTRSASSWRAALSPLHSIWKHKASVAKPGDNGARNSSFEIMTTAFETIISSVPIGP